MTNLDSMLKSRDITLPTKVRLVRAMVFPVDMYGCESWTVKKAEHQRIDALNCGFGTLPLTSPKYIYIIKSVTVSIVSPSICHGVMRPDAIVQF